MAKLKEKLSNEENQMLEEECRTYMYTKALPVSLIPPVIYLAATKAGIVRGKNFVLKVSGLAGLGMIYGGIHAVNAAYLSVRERMPDGYIARYYKEMKEMTAEENTRYFHLIRLTGQQFELPSVVLAKDGQRSAEHPSNTQPTRSPWKQAQPVDERLQPVPTPTSVIDQFTAPATGVSQTEQDKTPPSPPSGTQAQPKFSYAAARENRQQGMDTQTPPAPPSGTQAQPKFSYAAARENRQQGKNTPPNHISDDLAPSNTPTKPKKVNKYGDPIE